MVERGLWALIFWLMAIAGGIYQRLYLLQQIAE